MNEIRLLARLYATELGHEAVAGFIGEQDGLASIFYTDSWRSTESGRLYPARRLAARWHTQLILYFRQHIPIAEEL